jgi:hypothetical protein
MNRSATEQAGVVVMFYICTGEVLGLNLGGAPPVLTWIFHGFPQTLHTNSGTLLRLGHKGLLPYSFKLIINQSILTFDATFSELLTAS